MAIGKAVASGGVRQASFAKTALKVRSFLMACVYTLFEYPLGKPSKGRNDSVSMCFLCFFSELQVGKRPTRLSGHFQAKNIGLSTGSPNQDCISILVERSK